jgi:MerR family transcriptional regulator, redox-sensitive transcriptional activator SoxR
MDRITARMSERMSISEVARRVGLQASAIRYYEQIGLVPRAERISGQRRYDRPAVYRLAVIQRARQLGFTLDEVRELFFGFRTVPRAAERWQTLSTKKLAELDIFMRDIRAMRLLLRKMMERCHCETLDQCGKGIFQSGTVTVMAPLVKLRPSR